MLEKVIMIHELKRNETRVRLNQNKLRLGSFQRHKTGIDNWNNGFEIIEVKVKIG